VSSLTEGIPEAFFNGADGDLEFARRIRRDLLPGMLIGTDTFRLDLYHHPHDLVGSDYYEMVPLDEHRFGLLVADVRGHGVSAALYTMLLKNLGEKSADLGHDPGAFIAELNRALTGYAVDEQYATAVYALLDAEQQTLTWCSAGHPSILVHRADDDAVERLPSNDPPLGLSADSIHRVVETRLNPGDLVLLYTDGLLGQGDTFRLAELLRQERLDPSMDLPKRLYDRVLADAGADELDDDALILLLRQR
jgi:serine phosphatase RsbU (regulator of sigma subunit)